LTRAWERITTKAADDPPRFYPAMLTAAFMLRSALFTYEQSKAFLMELRQQ
jgi:hypothetical protein